LELATADCLVSCLRAYDGANLAAETVAAVIAAAFRSFRAVRPRCAVAR
jgi:hypothetical protein